MADSRPSKLTQGACPLFGPPHRSPEPIKNSHYWAIRPGQEIGQRIWPKNGVFGQPNIHLVIVIPPKYSVSAIIGKIKAKTSRERRNEFWSVGFFSSTVGVNEDVIKRYVEFQEKVDTGKLQLDLALRHHLGRV